MSSILLVTSSALIAFCIFYLLTRSLNRDTHTPKTKRIKLSSNRATWLSQANVNMSVQQFWLCTLLCGFAAFSFAFIFTKTILIAVVFGISAAWLPNALISKKRTACSRDIVNAWPEALRDISATISAGHSISFALSNLSRTGPEPISIHMKRFANLEKTLGFDAALESVREEMNDSTTDRIIEVLIIANSTGGKIIKEIIDDLIESTTEDISLAETIATESVEMKINSRAVVVLPWCVLALLTFSGSAFRDFYRSFAGTVVILIAATLSALGILILNKLTRQEIEPRVFSYSKAGN